MILVGSGLGRFPVNTYYRRMRTHIYGTFMTDTYVYEETCVLGSGHMYEYEDGYAVIRRHIDTHMYP